MVNYEIGSIVHLKFPFSDLSSFKDRPAVVLAKGGYGDLIICQITSKNKRDQMQLEWHSHSFKSVGLAQISYAKPQLLFTADPILVRKRSGILKKAVLDEVLAMMKSIFTPTTVD